VTTVAAGTCSITATQSGNSTYAAAAPVTQTFAVLSPSLSSQTITFGPSATEPWRRAPLRLARQRVRDCR
jgi:hypothetical protein